MTEDDLRGHAAQLDERAHREDGRGRQIPGVLTVKFSVLPVSPGGGRRDPDGVQLAAVRGPPRQRSVQFTEHPVGGPHGCSGRRLLRPAGRPDACPEMTIVNLRSRSSSSDRGLGGDGTSYREFMSGPAARVGAADLCADRLPGHDHGGVLPPWCRSSSRSRRTCRRSRGARGADRLHGLLRGTAVEARLFQELGSRAEDRRGETSCGCSTCSPSGWSCSRGRALPRRPKPEHPPLLRRSSRWSPPAGDRAAGDEAAAA